MPAGRIFQQDNDPKHTSSLLKGTKPNAKKPVAGRFKDNNTAVLPWPPQSPDLNSIEHLFRRIVVQHTRPTICSFHVLQTSQQCSCCDGVGVTLPILMALYRDDTDEEIVELSQILGFPSLEAMLQSAEFEDVVACDFTENALGGGVGKAEKVFCYRAIPTERTAHITKNICDAAFEKDRLAMQRDYKERSQLGNPLFNAKIVEGKIRLLTCVAKLNGEYEAVSVFDLQKEYYATYQVFLDKPELRRWFGKKHIKQIFDTFCFNDVEVSTDVERNGSLYIKMTRSFTEIMEECKRVTQDGGLALRDAPPNKNNFKHTVPEPSNGVERYKPTLVPLNSKNENFFTNDRLLARKFGAIDNNRNSSSVQPSVDPIATKFQVNQGYSRLGPQSDYEILSSEKTSSRNAEIIPGLSSGNNNWPETSIQQLKPHMVYPGGVDNNNGTRDSRGQAMQEIFDNGHSTGLCKKEWSSNVTTPKKDPLKYTSRAQGTYTDNESSDDENMAANNRLIQSQVPFKSRAVDGPLRISRAIIEKPISNGCESSAKSQWEDQSPVSNTGDGLVEITGDSPPAPIYNRGYAEKYMKKAADYQAESKARFMAERLAEKQRKTYDNEKSRLNQKLQAQGYPSSNGGGTAGSRFTTLSMSESTSENSKARGMGNGTGDSFGMHQLSHDGGDAKKDAWECADFTWADEHSKSQITQRSEQPTPTFGQVKRAPQAAIKQVLNDFGENNQMYAPSNGAHSYKNSKADQVPVDVRILAAYISSILMTRQSIPVNQLDDLIISIYGKKLHPSQGEFVEESWPAFVTKYCGKNVTVIPSATNPILVWKEQARDKMRKAMTEIGLQSDANSSLANPSYSNGF